MLKIHYLPKILVISLKRFQYNKDLNINVKINKNFSFPFSLDLKNFLLNIDNNKNNVTKCNFILKGIVVHQGEGGYGHYIAIIKDNDNDIWKCYDDKNVKIIDLVDIQNICYGQKLSESNNVENIKNAYILFYKKINENNCEKFNSINLINILKKK